MTGRQILAARPLDDVLPVTTRFYRQSGDHNAPTARHGDVVAFRQVDRFGGDGLYVLAVDKAPDLWRCASEIVTPGIRCWHARPEAGSLVTREQFREMVIGRVVGIVQVLDVDAFDSWPPPGQSW